VELLNLFYTFFKVGLFTIGGGLVAIPIMQDYVIGYKWVSEKTFVDMIAISQSTPGPIGINLATYVGQTQYGLLGSVVATLGMVLPSFIIISIVAKFLKHFDENKWVKAALRNIRPIVIGIIMAAAYFIAQVELLDMEAFKVTKQLSELFDIKSVVLFAVVFGLMFKIKLHPILYILIGGVLGIIIF
jgi:chromate transporter